jgi:DNA ligase-1
MSFKPMLASPADFDSLVFPKLISPKLDGVRAVVIDGVVYGRSLKPIRNQQVQELFGRREFNGLDGELIVGDPTGADVFRTTSSVVNSVDKTGDIFFHVFDDITEPDKPFMHRLDTGLGKVAGDQMLWVDQVQVDFLSDMESWEECYLAQGYEGAMLRDPNATYKFGRSTAKEQILLKVKRFTDSDAVVIGFQELMHNGNEAKINELGLTERSSHKENKHGMGILGALVCRDPHGTQFNIGTGFTQADREQIWQERDHLLHKTVKYKSFQVGVKEAPRHPVFLGWRD